MTLYSVEPNRAKSSTWAMLGTIYQAHNGTYLGRGPPVRCIFCRTARVFSDRAAQKIRNSERGWKYAAAQLEAFGATDSPRGSVGAYGMAQLIAAITGDESPA